MKITLELDEEALKEYISENLADRYVREYSSDRRQVDRVVSEEVRKIIYGDKERIIDRIVDQASRHLGNVAGKEILKKLMEDTK